MNPQNAEKVRRKSSNFDIPRALITEHKIVQVPLFIISIVTK